MLIFGVGDDWQLRVWSIVRRACVSAVGRAVSFGQTPRRRRRFTRARSHCRVRLTTLTITATRHRRRRRLCRRCWFAATPTRIALLSLARVVAVCRSVQCEFQLSQSTLYTHPTARARDEQTTHSYRVARAADDDDDQDATTDIQLLPEATLSVPSVVKLPLDASIASDGRVWLLAALGDSTSVVLCGGGGGGGQQEASDELVVVERGQWSVVNVGLAAHDAASGALLGDAVDTIVGGNGVDNEGDDDRVGVEGGADVDDPVDVATLSALLAQSDADDERQRACAEYLLSTLGAAAVGAVLRRPAGARVGNVDAIRAQHRCVSWRGVRLYRCASSRTARACRSVEQLVERRDATALCAALMLHVADRVRAAQSLDVGAASNDEHWLRQWYVALFPLSLSFFLSLSHSLSLLSRSPMSGCRRRFVARVARVSRRLGSRAIALGATLGAPMLLARVSVADDDVCFVQPSFVCCTQRAFGVVRAPLAPEHLRAHGDVALSPHLLARLVAHSDIIGADKQVCDAVFDAA